MVYMKPLMLGLKSRSALRLIMFHLPKKWVKCTKKRRFWESFSKGIKSFGQTCTHYFISCMLSPRPMACTCMAVVVL